MRPTIDIDTMLLHYMIAALWSTTDESTPAGGEPMDANYDTDDIAPKSADAMRAECAAFVATIPDADLIAYADAVGDAEQQIGHDFWLTRNGHGVGFWDRDLDDLGDRLTALADLAGEVYLYVGDDGVIYQSGAE